jgi:hypothetical protein
MKKSYLALVIGLVAASSQLSATPLIVDSFSAGVKTYSDFTNGSPVIDSEGPLAGVLGSTRYVNLTCITGSSPGCVGPAVNGVTFTTGAGLGFLAAGSGVDPTLTLSYNVPLANQNFTLLSQFILDFQNVDPSGAGTTGSVVFHSASGMSTATFGPLASGGPQAIALWFYSFVGNVDFANVTSVDVSIFGTRSADLTIEEFRVDTPEPATYALLGGGLLLLGAFRKRFKRS